ncbi:splicing factor, suppressor of white-apricot-like protein isoform X1 [Gossypium australe]|uniref:Splicing factor, suppressor of white-apricot-like protein isoform X1 n=1 Tax=Gossypium australe TaxID=47621 RepID=A0A5B6W7I3_9ROSI|nr:splicing factor, suppressor of white-apricot-like protein isoform X1 [Gossypium australe]
MFDIDVRHLLFGPPPPRKRRRHLSSPSVTADDTLEFDLDRERYLDLPPPSPSLPDQQDGDNNEEPATAGGLYNAVSFSYGNTGESNEQKDNDVESSFRPPFPVPETLLQNLNVFYWFSTEVLPQLSIDYKFFMCLESNYILYSFFLKLTYILGCGG